MQDTSSDLYIFFVFYFILLTLLVIMRLMIGFLSGTVISSGERHLLLDVGGVGYKIYATATLLGSATNAKSLEVWTHLVVKEDVLDLYGFQRESELDFFKLLLNVSGIGPKSALGVLDVAPVDTLQAAIASNDISYLTKVSGIGKKSAEKIVLELRDKMGNLSISHGQTLMHEDLDVVEALTALGFKEHEAREALNHLPPETKGTGQKVSLALKYLGE